MSQYITEEKVQEVATQPIEIAKNKKRNIRLLVAISIILAMAFSVILVYAAPLFRNNPDLQNGTIYTSLVLTSFVVIFLVIYAVYNIFYASKKLSETPAEPIIPPTPEEIQRTRELGLMHMINGLSVLSVVVLFVGLLSGVCLGFCDMGPKSFLFSKEGLVIIIISGVIWLSGLILGIIKKNSGGIVGYLFLVLIWYALFFNSYVIPMLTHAPVYYGYPAF